MHTRKDQVRQALNNFYLNELEKNTPRPLKHKNKKPENAVVAEILNLNVEGWFLNRFEAKSAYDPISKSYRMSHVVAGFPDIAGMCINGIAAYIEAKALGKRSTVRENQLDFLIKAIKHGGFGVVADSSYYVKRTYAEWILIAREDRDEGKKFLLDSLPKKKKTDDLFGF